jgi:TolB-like protein/Tfp pilus assembly protein PilF
VIGKTVSHYRIVEKLGQGGMGVVYKAFDTTLERPVALKFLSSHLQTAGDSFQRFFREARSASALNHPNILTIYGFEEIPGESFIVMEWVDGKTLKSTAGTASISELTGYASQIAAGLSKAHANGIIHRDIKADNIMVSSDGVIKIMDFGLAKLAGAVSLTKTGSTVGTIAYLSPEQLQGEEATEQSDIWSFGVVLYELLTGQLPFHAAHEAAMMYEIVNADPKPVRELRPDCPLPLDQLVTTMLAKDRSKRYLRVDDLLRDLNSGSTSRGTSGDKPAIVRPWWGRRTQLVSLACAGALGALLIGYAVLRGPGRGNDQLVGGTGGEAAGARSIAVLPFLNMSPEKENEYFSDGITEETITTLSQLPSLKVVPLTTALTYKGTQKSIDEIATALHVRYVLEGSVRKAGPEIRISTKLIELPGEKTLWVKAFNDRFEKIFDIQRQVANDIASALSIHLSSMTQIGRKYSPKGEAYASYLKGMFFRRKFNREGLEQAAQLLQQSTESDPGFADAYVQLAGVYASFVDLGYSSDTLLLVRADSLLSIAGRLNPDFSPLELISGFTADLRGDWVRAERSYRTGIRKDSTVWYGLSLLGWLLHAEGREEEAVRAFDGALRADPTVFTPLAGKAGALSDLGRFQEALRAIRDALAIEPANTLVLNAKANIFLQQMMSDSAQPVIELSFRADTTNHQTNLLQAEVFAARGNYRRARQFFRDASLQPEKNSLDAYQMAAYYALSKLPDSCYALLDRAVSLGFSRDAMMRNDRRFSDLRRDSTFLRIVSRVEENRLRWMIASGAR